MHKDLIFIFRLVLNEMTAHYYGEDDQKAADDYIA